MPATIQYVEPALFLIPHWRNTVDCRREKKNFLIEQTYLHTRVASPFSLWSAAFEPGEAPPPPSFFIPI